jgi:hypothetical protein
MAVTSWLISNLALATLAFSFPLLIAGIIIAARMAMIAITTSSSIKVKPRRALVFPADREACGPTNLPVEGENEVIHFIVPRVLTYLELLV